MTDLTSNDLLAINGGNADGRCNGIQLKWGDFVICIGNSTFP